MADKTNSDLASAFLKATGSDLGKLFDVDPVTPLADVQPITSPELDLDLEPRTLEDDPAFMQLLSAAEESNKMASASDKRSRKSLAVGVLTLLVALATLLVALFGSPFTTTTGTNTDKPLDSVESVDTSK